MQLKSQEIPLSQFVEISVEPHDAENLIKALSECSESFIHNCPGIIHSNVQVSDDGRVVLMHILWSTTAACRLAWDNANARESDFFGLIRRHHAKNALFKNFNLASEARVSPDSASFHVLPNTTQLNDPITLPAA